jgi:hypothetical protein
MSYETGGDGLSVCAESGLFLDFSELGFEKFALNGLELPWWRRFWRWVGLDAE